MSLVYVLLEAFEIDKDTSFLTLLFCLFVAGYYTGLNKQKIAT